MTGGLFRLSVAAFAALGLLAGCGTDTRGSETVTIAKQVIGQAFSPRTTSEELSGVSAEEMAQLLAAQPNPVVLVALEKVQSQGLFLRIATNGRYGTYGTASRQAVIFRNGIVTGTRGFGGDLMSSNIDALERAVLSGGGAGVPYVMEFINGEDQSEDIALTCDVAAMGQTRAAGGEVDAAVTQVGATCTDGKDITFTNIYMVDGAGRVLAARQWLGGFIEYVSIQHLRV